MKWDFPQILNFFEEKDNSQLLNESLHGMERECLRIDSKAHLSQKSHPQGLGSALKNPLVTTDFAEAQLELVTNTFFSENEALKFLEKTHVFVAHNLENELFWPFSMPCLLPKEDDIALANYGNSFEGLRKMRYRQGLAHRYGRKMQTVSGTHYNFSFSEKVWEALRDKLTPSIRQSRVVPSLQDFISDGYLHIIRNFLRYSWINTYLFGAAPVVDQSYLLRKPIFMFRKPKYLRRLNHKTFYGEYSCSFRMSELGYYSKVQAQLPVSFNSLKEYLKDLSYAVSTPSKKYKNLPGLNDNILQIEAEHYSRIRPKQILETKPGALGIKERPLEALAKRGIRYIEARAVDINPYSPIGLTIDQLEFLHIFLIYCLFKPSPAIRELEQNIITNNQNKVSIYGRKPDLKLNKAGKEVNMIKWAHELIEEMGSVAKILDKNQLGGIYTKSLKLQLQKLNNPELTPSARIIRDLKNSESTFGEFGLELAKKHCGFFRQQKLDDQSQMEFEDIAAKSLIDQKNQEFIDSTFTEGYEDLEFSTQILIKEALKRKIKVEVLDREENFIKLSKGWRTEYVKQATKTSKDSYMSFLIMENKNVTNQVLRAGGLQVPDGEAFTTLEAAIAAYPQFAKRKCVIKPSTTNHGIGISFADPNDKRAFTHGVEEAFKYAKTILVEEFISGEEYRILTIDHKTCSIVKRVPANVIGDGKHTVLELVEIKNSDPKYFKYFADYTIKTGEIELKELKSQKLNFKSIPKKGQQVFLRTNSNVGTGGDPVECLKEVHATYKLLAEKASILAKARICGIDMIIKNPKEPASKDNCAIIEINFNPALQMHHYPVQGKGVNVAAMVLDLLGF